MAERLTKSSTNPVSALASSPVPTFSSMTTNRYPTTTPVSLKRPRSEFQSPQSPRSFKSSLPKSPRYDREFLLPPLTGAAALTTERQKREERAAHAISENPAHRVIHSLATGSPLPMSRPTDAPAATTAMSTPMQTVAQSLIIPETSLRSQNNEETSPASVTSLASLGGMPATATASTSATASLSDANPPISRPRPFTGSYADTEARSTSGNTSFSYPGQAVAVAEMREPFARGVSYPAPGQVTPQPPARSSSSAQKKHKCTFCDTEFTRHHNLKSHLLTHSQEKPYICKTCDMRFRRLHDLKRHAKLHTGERPHKCPKCDRKFARGDALARHAKGQGGCAGRRTSVDGYDDAGDDDYEGSPEGVTGMDGIVYAEPEQTNELSDEDPRRASLPSIQAQHASHTSRDVSYPSNRPPSTYPPAGLRQRANTGNSLYVPGQEPTHSSSTSSGGRQAMHLGHSANTSISSAMHSTSGYMGGNMTESPKPLSPSGMVSYQLGHDNNTNRPRSPSLATQFGQQHFGRSESSRASPHINLPSPHTQGPKLPSIAGLAPPSSSASYPLASPVNLHSHAMSQGSAYQPQMMTGGPPQMMSSSVRNTPHLGHKPSNSRDSANMFASDGSMWSYVTTLESEVRALSERVLALEASERRSLEKISQLEKDSQERIAQLQQELSSSRTYSMQNPPH